MLFYDQSDDFYAYNHQYTEEKKIVLFDFKFLPQLIKSIIIILQENMHYEYFIIISNYSN